MILIDKDRCTGCGSCVRDCVAENLWLTDDSAHKQAQARRECFLCGHCVAVCPTGAVSIPEYGAEGMEGVEELGVKPGLDSGTLLSAIKSRRSVRDYRDKKVEREKLDLIFEAGRYTATAVNSQGCRFILVQENLSGFREMIWSGIERELSAVSAGRVSFASRYSKFLESRMADLSDDFLFRNAPAVLFIGADRADDAGLAAQNMELMACSLGLGMLYNGYLCRASESLLEAKKWLGAEEKTLQICALLGYPAVKYKRTAPRRAGDIVLR